MRKKSYMLYGYNKLSLRFSHSILILIQATQASRWLIFCRPVLLRLLSYGNENDNGNDKHFRSRIERELMIFAHCL